jgi:general secretion pathway protein G
MKNNRQHRSLHHSGFTLLEVMLVLFIIVSIAGLAVVAVRGQQASAQQRTAFAYVNTLKNAVDRYTLDIGRPPTSEQGLAALVSAPSDLANPGAWAGPYIEARATNRDPWGNNYQYACPGKDGREFDIWSFGRDMIDGTEDDIGSWTPSL